MKLPIPALPCIALLLSVVAATSALAADTDFRGYLDQAKFQIRSEYWDTANEALEQAVSHPDGRIDPEAWFLLAQVRYQLGDLPGAQQAASHALTYSREEGQTEATANFLDYVRTQFGLVRIEPSQPGLQAVLHPQLEDTLFDPELKRWVEAQQKRFKEDEVLLPVTIGLPLGKWTINGHQVEVKAEETAVIELTAAQTQMRGSATARLAWLEVSAGVHTWIGAGAHHLPSPDTQLALSLPVSRRVVVGVIGTWSFQALRLDDAQYEINPRAVTAGARVGLLLAGQGPLVVRPSIGYRYGTVAGLRLSCAWGETSLVCGEGPEDAVVYAEGRAHIPFIELSTDYLDRRRTSWVGGGVKVVLERAWAAAPKQGTSRGSFDLPFTVDDGYRSSTMYGARVLINLSMAF